MKTIWIRTRLTLLLTAIFLLGIVTGHLATRRFGLKAEVSVPASSKSTERPQSEAESGPQPKKEIQRATRNVMAQYRAALSLSDEQLTELKSLFKETGIEMSFLPKGSEQRLSSLESFHQKLREKLTPAQQKLSDEILERARARHSEKD